MTNEKFYSLKRYPNGRIVNLAGVFFQLSAEQIELLHEDDYSYFFDLQEELAYELFLEEEK